jgi:lipopolysaccharide biosynthesis glycosyltransferase
MTSFENDTAINNRAIPVFFATDEGYAPYLSVALRSLIEHASPNNDYRIMIVCQELSEATRRALADMATSNVRIELIPIAAQSVDLVSTDSNKLRYDYVTVTIYFRLFIAEMFPELNKALYIDADTVINADVAELFSVSLGSNLIAAVHDNFISANQETTDYVEEALGIPVHDYVNSGVLVMNLEELRKRAFAQRFTALLNDYHVQSIAADQDYLNVMCHGRILQLGREWNTMMAEPEALPAPAGVGAGVGSTGAAGTGAGEPKIIHYNLFGKPWNYRDAPNADYFWKYAPHTPYYAHLSEGLRRFDATKVMSDQRKKEGLIRQATVIPSNPITFRKLSEQGVRITL